MMKMIAVIQVFFINEEYDFEQWLSNFSESPEGLLRI